MDKPNLTKLIKKLVKWIPTKKCWRCSKPIYHGFMDLCHECNNQMREK